MRAALLAISGGRSGDAGLDVHNARRTCDGGPIVRMEAESPAVLNFARAASCEQKGVHLQ